MTVKMSQIIKLTHRTIKPILAPKKHTHHLTLHPRLSEITPCMSMQSIQLDYKR